MEGAENVITYIDDVLIHSKNHKEHLGHLEEAIKRIQRAHLRLNAYSQQSLYNIWDTHFPVKG